MSEEIKEAGRTMEPADALRMLARANDWLRNELRQSKNCQCGACYLCAFYTIEQVILDRRSLIAALAERDQQLALINAELSTLTNYAEQVVAENKRMQERIAELTADTERLNQMIREHGYGQGAIDTYVAQCEELERAKERIADLHLHMALVRTMGTRCDKLAGMLHNWLACTAFAGELQKHETLITETETLLREVGK